MEARLEIHGLDEVLTSLRKILLRLDELESRVVPEWASLSEAAKLKNLSIETLKKNPQWGPPPAEARIVCGRRRWHRSVILEWLPMDDTALDPDCRKLRAV